MVSREREPNSNFGRFSWGKKMARKFLNLLLLSNADQSTSYGKTRNDWQLQLFKNKSETAVHGICC